MKKKVSRREFLKLGIAALAGAAIPRAFSGGGIVDRPTQIRMHEASPEEEMQFIPLEEYAEKLGVSIDALLEHEAAPEEKFEFVPTEQIVNTGYIDSRHDSVFAPLECASNEDVFAWLDSEDWRSNCPECDIARAQAALEGVKPEYSPAPMTEAEPLPAGNPYLRTEWDGCRGWQSIADMGLDEPGSRSCGWGYLLGSDGCLSGSHEMLSEDGEDIWQLPSEEVSCMGCDAHMQDLPEGVISPDSGIRWVTRVSYDERGVGSFYHLAYFDTEFVPEET